MSENKAPSPETTAEINKAANWLSEWLTSRYNQGYLSKDDYETSIQRLKDVKVFTTSKWYDRVIEALENKDIKLNEEAYESALDGYNETYKTGTGLTEKQCRILKMSGYKVADETLSDEQKAITYLKDYLSSKPTSEATIGFNAAFCETSAIFLNIDQVQKEKDNIKAPSISSIAVHELTHNLRLESQEQLIRNGLYNENPDSVAKYPVPTTPAVAPIINVQIISDTDAPQLEHTKEKEPREPNINFGVVLKEGVKFDKYLDSDKEVYARLMQLRYDFNLKPDETFSEEQINEIETRAQKAKAEFNSAENAQHTDIDFNIIERYRNNTLQYMLNEVAETTPDDSIRDLKNSMLNDSLFAKYKKKAIEETPKKDKPKTNNHTELNPACINRGYDRA